MIPDADAERTSPAAEITRRNSGGVLVDTADLPRGGKLHLVTNGDDFEILFDEEQLMGSWQNRSERALATLVCERLRKPEPRILIGGLGMGFTLAAALAALPAAAQVVVAELVPKVALWARGPLAHIFNGSLEDSRVLLEIRDVHDVIVETAERFDAILLDVDNGPDGLIDLANERLYCGWGLRAAGSALRPGGILAVWSAYQDPSFTDRLVAAGFEVHEHSIQLDEDGREPEHTIWLAAKSK